MEVKMISRSEQEWEDCDYRQAFVVEVNGKVELSVHDGEAEDANLSRDFSDVYNVAGLMLMAYEAGKRGEEFSVIQVESDEV